MIDLLCYWVKHWEISNCIVNFSRVYTRDIKEILINLDFSLLD
jgi:hypothetical protein